MAVDVVEVTETEKILLARYNSLCAKRDEVNAKKQPLEEQLAEQNALSEQARLKAAEIAAQIDAIWLEANWFSLKREIAVLARALSKPNGLLATKTEE